MHVARVAGVAWSRVGGAVYFGRKLFIRKNGKMKMEKFPATGWWLSSSCTFSSLWLDLIYCTCLCSWLVAGRHRVSGTACCNTILLFIRDVSLINAQIAKWTCDAVRSSNGNVMSSKMADVVIFRASRSSMTDNRRIHLGSDGLWL